MNEKPKIHVIEVCSIGEAIEQALKLVLKAMPHALWYRGVNDRDFELMPSVYRGKWDEIKLFQRFVDNGHRFPELSGLKGVDRFFSGQHFGLPTRLLDWSESFLHAMFFAFDGAKLSTKEPDTSPKTPSVWILNPSRYNKAMGLPVELPRADQDLLKQWFVDESKPVESSPSTIPEYPVAFTPRRTNKRIVAQHGTFTVHGSKRDCLTKFLISNQNTTVPRDILTRIDLVGFKETETSAALPLLGLVRSAIYPDIVNFVQSLKDSRGLYV